MDGFKSFLTYLRFVRPNLSNDAILFYTNIHETQPEATFDKTIKKADSLYSVSETRLNDVESAVSSLQLQPAVPTAVSSSFTTIFAGPPTTSFNIFSEAGGDKTVTWNPSTNNSSYIDGFAADESDIVFAQAGEYQIHAALVSTANAASGRVIQLLQLEHVDSIETPIYTYTLGSVYFRDLNASYNAGGLAGGIRLKVAADDIIRLKVLTLDEATTGASIPLDSTYSQIKIDRIDYTLS